LESDALAEMLRWVDQPGIGMVGCRLNYPNGRLQHGGVRLVSRDTRGLQWEHIEKHRTFDELNETKSLHICDAVTAACAMMKRKLFLDVEGFDEIWYPIGYSDTNMATKIKARGLKCFYTPYAVGVHHESVSRKSSIEDFESSVWLHRLWQNDQRLRSK
jgi:GT2 family glycosyltransferase